MLDLATKANIRRHLGLPAAGTPLQGGTLGLRSVTRAGQLEYYMNALQLEEEALILGQPYGAVQITDPVGVGNTVHLIILPVGAGSPTVVPYTVLSSDNAASVCAALASLTNAAGLSGFIAAGLSISQVGSNQVSLRSQTLFTLTTSVTGTTNVALLANGSFYPQPQYTLDDGNGDPTQAIIAYGILPVCNALESQLLNASQNLSFSMVGSTATGAADFRKDELIVRNSLLQRYRHELGVMLGFYQPDQVSGIPSFGIEV